MRKPTRPRRIGGLFAFGGGRGDGATTDGTEG